MAEETPGNLGASAFGGFMMGRATGSRRTDETIDRLNNTLERFSDTLQRLISSLDSQSKVQGATNGGVTQQGSVRMPNGGNATFGGSSATSPGAHRAEPDGAHRAGGPTFIGPSYGPLGNGGQVAFGNGGPPTPPGGRSAGWGFYPGGRGDRVVQRAGGARGIAGGVGRGLAVGATVYTANHYGNQVMGQSLAAQYAGGQDWSESYQSMIPNNYTAANDADAMQSAGYMASLGGYAPTSTGFQQLRSGVLGTSLVDPSVTNMQSAQATLSMQSVGQVNRGLAYGINTRGRSTASIANQILTRVPGQNNIRSIEEINAALGPTGGITVTLQDAVRSGVLTKEAAPAVRSQIRSILTARINGMDFKEYNRNVRTAATNANGTAGDKARDRLREVGLANSMIERTRTQEGTKRDTESRTIEGFTDSMRATTSVLDNFRGALNRLLDGPLGYTSGMSSGILGNVPGVSGILHRFIPGMGDGPANMAGSAMMYASAGGGDGLPGSDGPANLSSGAASYGGAGGRLPGSEGPASLSAGSASYGGSSRIVAARSGSSGSAQRVGSRYSLGPVKPWVSAAANHLGPRFGIRTVYGYGSRSNVSDHPKGLALDFMCGKGAGDSLAAYAKAHHKQLNITYIIWRQRIWSINYPGWRKMENRGSATANHMDHVHISFKASPSSANLGGLPSGVGPAEAVRSGGAITSSLDIGGSDFTSSGGASGAAYGGAADGGGGSPYGGYSEVAALGLGGGASGGGAVGAASFGSATADTAAYGDAGATTTSGGGGGKAVPTGGGKSGPYRPGGGVEQWRDEVAFAMQKAGVKPTKGLVDRTLMQMRTESSGNPRAVNRWDSNWQAGHPSVGLMQVIEGTFNSYAGPYRNKGPKMYGVSVDPIANIYASVKYATSRYGSLKNAYQGHGYEIGSWNIRADQDTRVHKGEMIVPSKIADVVRTELTAPGIRGDKKGVGGGVSVVFQTGAVTVQAMPGTSDKDARRVGSKIMDAIVEDRRWTALAEG